MDSIQLQKLELLEWMASLQDKYLIKELVKWKEEHTQTDINQYNKELDAAEMAIKQGKFTKHADAVNKIRSWREK